MACSLAVLAQHLAAIAEVSTTTGQSGQGAGAAAVSGSFSPANLMWLGALAEFSFTFWLLAKGIREPKAGLLQPVSVKI